MGKEGGQGEKEENGKGGREETNVGMSAPAKNFLSTPPGVMTAIRMTPPEDPSRAIARERAENAKRKGGKVSVPFLRRLIGLELRSSRSSSSSEKSPKREQSRKRKARPTILHKLHRPLLPPSLLERRVAVPVDVG